MSNPLTVAVPLVGGLIRNPHGAEEPDYYTTGWAPAGNGGKQVRLTREDGTPIRPEDVSVGGQMTVFPGIPHGATNQHADSPTLLIHLRGDDAQQAREANTGTVNEGAMYGNYIAYSKVCTHAGCPASLYEQQTNRLLCPCSARTSSSHPWSTRSCILWQTWISPCSSPDHPVR